MGKGFKHGTSGGNNPLNFYVKIYPSETELKADNPKENTIGVITTTTMSSWVFSATEPTEPEVGMVWISVGTSSASEFNALKENVLQVYPGSAKQYVSGKWSDIPAMSYQNGNWIDWWSGELYIPNNQFESYTGGWLGDATIGSGGIVTISGSSGLGETFYTAEKVTKGKKTKLCVNITSLTRSGGVLNLMATRTNDETAPDEDKTFAYIEITAKGKHSLDISNVTDPFYVYLYAYNSITAKFDKIVLE